VPNFRYRALTQNGEIVHGTLSAPTAAEVAHRIEYLRLLPIETIEDKATIAASSSGFGFFGRPSPAEVTTFTRDMALLLKAGARLDDALELLADDADVGRLRPVVGKLRAALLTGESFAGAVADHPSLFPAMYVALVRVGEVSGTLDQVLEMLGAERARAELMRRKLTDAMQYPTFVLIAAACVMLFFILFVLPQFSAVLQDFGAKSDSALSIFIKLSDFLRANAAVMMFASASFVAGVWYLLRRPGAGAAIMTAASGVPGIAGVFQFYRTSLFCRNLGVLLGSGVNLTATLRILVDIMAVTGSVTTWTRQPIAFVTAASFRTLCSHQATCHRWQSACCGWARRPGNCRCWRAGSPNSTRRNCSAALTVSSASSGRLPSSPSAQLSGD